MNEELVKITTNDEGVNCVSARELHEGLKAGQKFNDWITRRITKYGFEENVDYITLWFDELKNENVEFNGNVNSMVRKGYKQDYIITVDMAKELCMVENWN